ncbi:aldehyde dehydrogenase [Flagellimonas meridianipacifica]|uniref:Aldehyde dehydrogenase n=1 Tax=Flagellimonas meridianipacifica TaxID=1080225 RepID=A0A2T0MBX4_9FLAO|nr:aldehyde dehydrogenase [Allomuricauda pacifica]PRX54986.1 aldehyde dehydrogenase (NAD+) [Allomuricauda pacifica]
MIKNLVETQKSFFASQQTKDVSYRKTYLKKLYKALIAHEDDICEAIYRDFKKPKFESLVTETQIVLSELKYIINNLDEWTRPERVSGPLANFPSSDWLYHEPYGTVLIISPWNYPFMLAISPLIGALAAGNTAVLKPSELSPNTSRAILKLLEEVFDEEYVSVVEGGVEVSQELLSHKWDYIFFTGSSHVGKIIYQSAAEHLTPVTLELGGKNPCIVDETAAIKLAAKRIVWGKFMNAGQTCVAPDYILVHKSVKDGFVDALKKNIQKFYGSSIEASDDLARITTKKHYESLKAMITGQTVLSGGSFNDETQYIEPTLIDEPDLESHLMKGEIFGPILPILSYDSESEIGDIILRYEKPLSLYVFSTRKKFQQKIINTYGFGGGGINDVIMHIANKNLPFGGVGESGIGGYHGKHSFKLFSHKKSLVKKPNWGDIPFRYPPYTLPLKWIKLFRHLF